MCRQQNLFYVPADLIVLNCYFFGRLLISEQIYLYGLIYYYMNILLKRGAKTLRSFLFCDIIYRKSHLQSIAMLLATPLIV